MKDFKKLIKDWRMATIWGILLWVLIFVVVSVLMFGFPNLYSDWMTLLTNPFLIVFCAWMYFKQVKGDVKQGVYLGIYWIILGTILDVIITVPLFVKTYSFFTHWTLWLGWVETIAFSALTARSLKK